MVNKAKAIMIGHAIGDALGVPVEFSSREELDNNPVEDMEGYGTYPVPAGAWSDDTSMSLATLHSLRYGVNYGDMMEKFCEWLNNAKYTPTDVVFDTGRTVMKSLMAYMQRQGDCVSCGQKSHLDNGNGSLMRIHPVVLYLADKDMDVDAKINIIHTTSALTHAHERSKMACGIYAFILWELLKNPAKEAISEGIRKARVYYAKAKESHTFIRVWLNIGRGFSSPMEETIFPALTRDKIKSTGYVVDTFEAALWCLMNTSSYKECVLTAVNLGDDTDTVAAIAGGLAGALYGYDSIPQNWKDTLIKRNEIEQLCENVFANK